MNDNKVTGIAIKTLRKKANRTLRESAEQCGHTTSWLSDIESGRRALDFNDARVLCKYYGFTLTDLSDTFDIINNIDVFDK
jgi:transcriptional regulator with XRE-family HTH domain